MKFKNGLSIGEKVSSYVVHIVADHELQGFVKIIYTKIGIMITYFL